MFPKVFHDLSKPKLMQLLESIKRSEGKAVAELAEELEMSYMGVKQHCIKLEEMGYVKPWRVPRKEAGRPVTFLSLHSSPTFLPSVENDGIATFLELTLRKVLSRFPVHLMLTLRQPWETSPYTSL